MLFIPGKLIGLVTFPGIIVHELGHLAMCKIAGVRVHEFSLLRWQGPMGYVVHEKPDSLFHSFLITFGPFFANSLITVLLIAIGGTLSYIFPLLGILFLWLAASVGMHAFPSFQDAKSLLAHTKESIGKGNYLGILYLPFVGLIYLGGALSFFWADLAYAGLLIALALGALGLPLFYNISEAPAAKVVSGNATVIGCSLYLDGELLGESTKEAREIKIPKKLVESKDEHTFKCEFVGCREWKVKTPETRKLPLVGVILLNT